MPSHQGNRQYHSIYTSKQKSIQQIFPKITVSTFPTTEILKSKQSSSEKGLHKTTYALSFEICNFSFLNNIVNIIQNAKRNTFSDSGYPPPSISSKKSLIVINFCRAPHQLMKPAANLKFENWKNFIFFNWIANLARALLDPILIRFSFSQLFLKENFQVFD